MKIIAIFLLSTCLIQSSHGAEPSLSREEKFFLFNIVKFDNDACQGDDENEIGLCYTKAECSEKGGRETTDCASGFGTCCIIETNCNSSDNPVEAVQYFQSPSYPQFDAMPNYCSRSIKIVNNEICQVRIDFLDFEMGGPSMTMAPFGQCLNDRMSIFYGNTKLGLSGGNSLCGNMKGQHIYIDVRESEEEALRIFTMVGNVEDTLDATVSPSSVVEQYKWNLQIRQISCNDNSDLRAPTGCLQYFPSPMGHITSFNFGVTNSPYPASMDYTICFKKLKGFCGISFQAVGNGNKAPVFGLNYNGDGSNPYGEICYGDADSASNDFLEVLAGSYRNPGVRDYFPTSHICGLKSVRNLPVFRTTYPGPWMLRFKSDDSLRLLGGNSPVVSVDEANTLVGAGGETGFRLKYRLIQSC